MQVTFKATRKDLINALKIVKYDNQRVKRQGLMRISILPDAVEFFNQGVSYKVAAETEGLADVSLPDHLVKAYLDTSNLPMLNFTIKPGQLICGSSIFNSPAITVEAFMSTKESPLPVNADDLAILRCCHNKDKKWLQEYGLEGDYVTAQGRMKYKIGKAIEILAPYNITSADLKQLITKKLGGDLE